MHRSVAKHASSSSESPEATQGDTTPKKAKKSRAEVETEKTAKKAATITQTLRLEIVKPLDGDWNKLGDELRALCAPLHRVMTRTMLQLAIQQQLDESKPKDETRALQSCAYTFVGAYWDEEIAAAGQRMANQKGYSGDDRIAATPPSSALQLGAAGRVYDFWKRYDKAQWKGDMQLPTFGSPAALCLASSKASPSVRVSARDGNFLMDLRLLEGRTGNWRTLIVNPYGGRGHAELKYILAHPEAIGDCRLQRIKVRTAGKAKKTKWQAFISFTRAAPELRPLGRVMAVHRGVTNFLAYAIARDPLMVDKDDVKRKEEAITEVISGDHIVEFKRKYAARRASLGRHAKMLGSGAKGHGEARRFERITRLEDADRNWTRTQCQMTAAHLMKVALQRGAGTILLEDWNNPVTDSDADAAESPLNEHVEFLVRSFPMAQLKDQILWSAKKTGLTVKIVPGAYNSQDCPKCGERMPPRTDLKVFQCSNPACLLKRPVDMIAAWNMLVKDGQPLPLADANAANKRQIKNLLAAAKAAKKEH